HMRWIHRNSASPPFSLGRELGVTAGEAVAPGIGMLLSGSCLPPLDFAYASHTPQRLIGHHPLSRCQAPSRLIGTDPNHAMDQSAAAARCWDGSTPSPRPRLLDQADEALQRLGAHQRPAVDGKVGVPVTPTRVPSSTSPLSRALWAWEKASISCSVTNVTVVVTSASSRAWTVMPPSQPPASGTAQQSAPRPAGA